MKNTLVNWGAFYTRQIKARKNLYKKMPNIKKS